jgi:hypothetical protein
VSIFDTVELGNEWDSSLVTNLQYISLQSDAGIFPHTVTFQCGEKLQ